MNMKVSNEVPNKITKQSIKHEKQFIPKSDSKRTREDISSDDEEQPNKRKRQSVIVKEEPIETEIQCASIAFLNEESNEESTTKATDNIPIKSVNTSKLTTSNGKKCDVCNKTFSSSTNLRYHQRVHTGERPFHCDICEKRFTRSAVLERHKRIHSGEKPYFCEICHKCFSQLSSLVQHRRIHTGEKPYQCNICKKRFINSSHLSRHKRIHNREKH